MPELGKRFLVDIENDHPVIHLLRHGKPNLGVINDGIEVVDERYFVALR